MREVKSSTYAVKAIKDRTVVGIASVFGNVDDVGDIIWPGAYRKTIMENARRIKHLWMHDPMQPPIASIDDIKEIGREELPEQVLADAPNALGGLQVTRTYFDTPRADEIFQAVKAGAINELSIGYDPIGFDFNEVDGQRVRNLRELRLYDTSDVTWGANSATANFIKLAGTMPAEVLLKQIQAYLEEIKAGARHSASDVSLLNAIHKAAVELGATQCKGIVGEEDASGQDTASEDTVKGRAGGAISRAALPPTLQKIGLDILELEIELTQRNISGR